MDEHELGPPPDPGFYKMLPWLIPVAVLLWIGIIYILWRIFYGHL